MTPAWLEAVLPAASGFTRPVRVERVDPIGVGFGLASALVRVGLSGAAKARTLVVKLWEFQEPAEAGEIHFYRTLAARTGVRLPACHHADLDERTGRAVLVLEDLAGASQGDCLEHPSPARARSLAQTLAATHASWWNRSEIHEARWLPDAIVERSPEWLASRTRVFLDAFGDRLTPAARDLLDRAAEIQDGLRRCLEDAPVTLLHGDLHLDNVLFERGSDRPVFLDWARATRGPYALDLASLLYGILAPGDRDAALEAYVSEARARGAEVPDRAVLRRHLVAAGLAFFYRSTCGIALWNPASERERRMREASVKRAIDAVAEWGKEAQDQ